jgi:choline dehydrogenase-like flavoprotein
VHYTAYFPAAQADDFQLRTLQGAGVDWPIAYAEIEPYYVELEAYLGISGPADYPWGARRRYALPPLPMNGAAQLMERACASLGIRTAAAPNAAVSRPWMQEGYGLRPACTNRGFCQAGCSTGAKSSVDVTFIPLAIHHGCELRTECFVTGHRTGRGRASERRRLCRERRGAPAALPRGVPLRRRGGDARACC